MRKFDKLFSHIITHEIINTINQNRLHNKNFNSNQQIHSFSNVPSVICAFSLGHEPLRLTMTRNRTQKINFEIVTLMSLVICTNHKRTSLIIRNCKVVNLHSRGPCKLLKNPGKLVNLAVG